MAATVFYIPKAIPLNITGSLMSGAKANFFISGTTTLQNTFTDKALATPHANPVVADGNGVFAVIYLDATLLYRLDLTDSLDVSLSGYPVDDLNPALAAVGISIADTAGNYTATKLEATLTEISKVAGIGSDHIVVKTADTDRNTTTTNADDPHLTGITLDANSYYEFELQINYDQNVGNLQWSFNIDNQDQNSRVNYDVYDSQSTPTEVHVVSAWSTNLNGDRTITTMTDGDLCTLSIKGVVNTHASNATSLAFEWAQQVSSANDTTLFEGSWMRFRKIN